MNSILQRDTPVNSWTPSDHVKEAETAAHWFVGLLLSAGLGAAGKWTQHYFARRAAMKLMAKQINPRDPHEKTLREMVRDTRAEVDKTNAVRDEQYVASTRQFEALRNQMDILRDSVSENSARSTELSKSMNDIRRELVARDEKQESRDLQLRREMRLSIKRLRKAVQSAAQEQVSDPKSQKEAKQ